MDLNYLYYRQQVSLFRSQHAACDRSRRVHRALANGYDAQIHRVKSGTAINPQNAPAAAGQGAAQ